MTASKFRGLLDVFCSANRLPDSLTSGFPSRSIWLTKDLVHHGNWTDFSLPDENSGSSAVGPVEEGKDR
jgi:hypothetical protein